MATSVDCGLCQSSYHYRGRKICGLHGMSTPFARADVTRCGPEARDFRALGAMKGTDHVEDSKAKEPGANR